MMMMAGCITNLIEISCEWGLVTTLNESSTDSDPVENIFSGYLRVGLICLSRSKDSLSINN
jgi:hypothetical protein